MCSYWGKYMCGSSGHEFTRRNNCWPHGDGPIKWMPIHLAAHSNEEEEATEHACSPVMREWDIFFLISLSLPFDLLHCPSSIYVIKLFPSPILSPSLIHLCSRNTQSLIKKFWSHNYLPIYLSTNVRSRIFRIAWCMDGWMTTRRQLYEYLNT